MRRLYQTIFTTIICCTSVAANAVIIDFVDMTENGAYGESAYSTLSIAGVGFNVDITGTKNGQDAYAYLDWSHAGLGVCGDVDAGNVNQMNPGSGSNVCNPGSDDNVTTGEALSFVFDADVVIDKIWLNNTHDPDLNILNPDVIIVDGVATFGPGNGYAPTSGGYNGVDYDGDGNLASVNNFLGSYFSSAGNVFTIAFADTGDNGQQFYISGIEVHAVPEPGTLALLGAGLLGLGFMRRRKAG